MMTEMTDFDFDESWRNRGDANPEPNGGRFVRWDGEKFVIVSIDRQEAVMPDAPEGEGHYVVRKTFVEPDDIWTDGEPSSGFTDAMTAVLEALGDTNHFEAPGGPPFMNRVGYYVADMPFHMSDQTHNFEEGDFEEVLQKYGVDSWE